MELPCARISRERGKVYFPRPGQGMELHLLFQKASARQIKQSIKGSNPQYVLVFMEKLKNTKSMLSPSYRELHIHERYRWYHSLDSQEYREKVN